MHRAAVGIDHDCARDIRDADPPQNQMFIGFVNASIGGLQQHSPRQA